MWHTSRGDRTLTGHEAALVRHAIDSMLEALLMYIDEENDRPGPTCETGISVYDSCSVHQRIGLLHQVATYLLTETESPPALSATLEGTIAAIFVDIRDQVAIEIELSAEIQQYDDALSDEVIYESGEEVDSDVTGWRRLVLQACRSLRQSNTAQPAGDPGRDREANDDQATSRFGPLPAVNCDQIRDWEPLIDDLCEAILWDRDYEMADSFLDEDPDISRSRRQLLGISEDYFTRIAPDPRPQELNQWVDQTRAIVRGKPR